MGINTKTVSTILLAGGVGSRMQQAVPKQYLPLKQQPIALYSFQLFMEMDEVDEIIVVCAPAYRSLFTSLPATKPIHFALPGDRRQDSVYNGLLAASATDFMCIHDSARPFIDHQLVLRVLHAGLTHGAAAVGMPIKFTIKQCTADHNVHSTPDRSLMWEIQTPQVVATPLLREGFTYAHAQDLTVTDDVSLVELLQKPVKLVIGSENNLKITTPLDLTIAEHLLSQHFTHAS